MNSKVTIELTNTEYKYLKGCIDFVIKYTESVIIENDNLELMKKVILSQGLSELRLIKAKLPEDKD